MFKRAVLFITALTAFAFSVCAIPSVAYGYEDLSFSALYNHSYSDRISDAIINPSALSRVESDNIFYFTFIVSESWDTEVFKEKQDLYGLQNLNTELQVSFVGNSLSLTAVTSTWFSNRTLTSSGLSYDIYNRIDLQIDWSMSFDFFSAGIRLKGGGDMQRRSRSISGAISAIEHAYFGTFSNVDGSEYFSIGAALGINFDIVSAVIVFDDIVSYSGSRFVLGWEELIESGTFAFSLRHPKYTSRGDLYLFRPRFGLSITGNALDRDAKAVLTFNGELELQLLPSLSLRVAAAYREYDHYMFSFNRDNGVLMFALGINSDRYAVSLMCNVSTEDFSRIYPAISFTLSR